MSQALTILTGDCREILKTLPDESVQCVVTSPPYFGLRDYGHANQIGLEKTPQAYVQTMREVFGEVFRILKADGTLWLNLGDSFANDGKWGGHTGGKHVKALHCSPIGRNKKYTGLKPKDLIGIPWMVAFALRDHGYYLRSDIIWSKPNPMPESVTDRPTKSHEYLFLFSKRDRYFYDGGAIAEPVMQSSLVRAKAGVAFGGNNLCPDTRLQSGKEWVPKAHGANSRVNRSRDPKHAHEYNGKHRQSEDHAAGKRMVKNVKEARDNGGEHDAPFGMTRNRRSVWTVPTAPYRDSHFATFPPDLIKPCILAGCPVGGLVLDPFAGSGTTGMVALELGRRAILIELNPEYVQMAQARTNVTPGLHLTHGT